MWHDIFDYSWIDMREPDMSFASIPMFIRVHPREEKSGILNIVRRAPVPPSQCWAAGPIPTNQRNTHTYETLQHWNRGYRGSIAMMIRRSLIYMFIRWNSGYQSRGLHMLHSWFMRWWYGNWFRCTAGETVDIQIVDCRVWHDGLYDDVTVMDLHVHEMEHWKSIPDYCSWVWIPIQSQIWRHSAVRESKIVISYCIRNACPFHYFALLFWT